MQIEIGMGEAFDRLSILEIKCKRLHDKKKKIAEKQFQTLFELVVDEVEWLGTINPPNLYDEIRAVNNHLWELEDDIRKYIKKSSGTSTLLDIAGIAMDIARVNDKRHELKNKIDKKYGSKISEVKGYDT